MNDSSEPTHSPSSPKTSANPRDRLFKGIQNIGFLAFGLVAGAILAALLRIAGEVFDQAAWWVFGIGILLGGWVIYFVVNQIIMRALGRSWGSIIGKGVTSGKLLMDKPKGVSLLEYLSKVETQLTLKDLQKGITSVLSLSGMLTAALTLTTLAFTIMGSLVALLQIVRLDRQNELIELQNRITVVNQEFEQSRESALSRYQEVKSALTDRDASRSNQIFALQQLPETMVLPVRQAVSDNTNQKTTDIRIQSTYPNAVRLRELLVRYIKGRTIQTHQPEESLLNNEQPFEHTLLQSLMEEQFVSSQVLETLHVLGPVEGSSISLWNWDPESGTPPPPVRPWPKREGMRKTPLDLRHLSPDVFAGARLPYLKCGEYESVYLPAGVSFRRAILSRSDFSGCDLTGASFESAHLEGSWFTQAKLTGSVFKQAMAPACRFNEADVRLADFRWSQVQCSQFLLTHAEGSLWNSANVSGSDFYKANFDQAGLYHWKAYRCRFVQTVFKSAPMLDSRLSGSHFDSCDFTGSNLEMSVFCGDKTEVRWLKVGDGIYIPLLQNGNHTPAISKTVAFEAASLWECKPGFTQSHYTVPGSLAPLIQAFQKGELAMDTREMETVFKFYENLILYDEMGGAHTSILDYHLLSELEMKTLSKIDDKIIGDPVDLPTVFGPKLFRLLDTELGNCHMDEATRNAFLDHVTFGFDYWNKAEVDENQRIEALDNLNNMKHQLESAETELDDLSWVSVSDWYPFHSEDTL